MSQRKITIPKPSADGRCITARCANPDCSRILRPRLSDRKRGWGKYCTKSCKAIDNPVEFVKKALEQADAQTSN